MTPGDEDPRPPALPVGRVDDMVHTGGVGDEGVLEVVDNVHAHQPRHQTREKPVGHEWEEVEPAHDWVGGLVHGGVRLHTHIHTSILCTHTHIHTYIHIRTYVHT